MKSLVYASLVRPILDYGADCWDLYREVRVIGSDGEHKQAAKFATRMKESVWETLAQRRKVARISGYSNGTQKNGYGRLLGTVYKDHVT
jgi:hypothetical protein